MAISKELRLGTIALITLGVMVWGYNFLKGQKVFAERTTFYSVYNDVYQLAVSSPVYINGLPVGSVSKIEVNPDNVKEMKVSYMIEGEFSIPKDAKAVMISEGIVGGRAISIKYDHNCDGDCAPNGSELEAGIEGLIESMVTKEEIGDYVEAFKDALDKSFGGEGSNGTIKNLDSIVANLASLTGTFDQVMKQSANNLSKTMDNIESITGNIAQNNEQISGIISNLDKITSDLEAAKMSTVVEKADMAMENTNTAITSLQKTIEDSGVTLDKINSLLDEVKNGEGSLSKLLNDKALYENMEETSKNLSLLLQDLRLNPKRYVSVSIFGGGNDDDYVKPENDPAFEEEKK